LDRQVRKIEDARDAAQSQVRLAIEQRASDLDAYYEVSRALAAANERNVRLHEENVDLISRLAQSEEEKRTLAQGLLDQIRTLLSISDGKPLGGGKR